MFEKFFKKPKSSLEMAAKAAAVAASLGGGIEAAPARAAETQPETSHEQVMTEAQPVQLMSEHHEVDVAAVKQRLGIETEKIPVDLSREKQEVNLNASASLPQEVTPTEEVQVNTPSAEPTLREIAPEEEPTLRKLDPAPEVRPLDEGFKM